MILFLHNRYRTTGGEERAVADIRWLVSEHLREPTELVERDSALLGRARAAAGMLRGGLDPEEIADAVRRTGARVVHAHNVNPALGWRALAAARDAGARVVLHLHNYRLVCAVGTCFNSLGEDCARCHGRNTAPGIRLNCRGTGPEAVVYGTGLALHQRRLVEQVDAVVVPSAFARERLRVLGAPLRGKAVHVVGHAMRRFADRSTAASGTYALVAARLSPEKGVEAAIDACRRAGVPLVIAGDGPAAGALRVRAAGADVRFTGRVSDDALAGLRAGAGLAVVPSRAAETFGLAAAEAMAAGLPGVATPAGALTELVPGDQLVAPGDITALAQAVGRVFRDADAGERGLAAVRESLAPEVVAERLRAVYGTG